MIQPRLKNHQHGMVGMQEMLLLTLTIAIIGGVFASKSDNIVGLSQRARIERATTENRLIADALYDYARLHTDKGNLSAPGTDNRVYNPAAVEAPTLESLFGQAGLATAEINTDGMAAGNARVYQRATGFSMNVPLFGKNGTSVALNYEIGTVYLTNCPYGTASCYTNGRPGNSATLTSANATTWTADTNDIAPAMISTLPLQRAKLAATVSTLNVLRDRITEYVTEQQRAAAADITTNFWPKRLNNSLKGLDGKASAAANGNCHDGWYNLSSDTVLTNVSLDTAEHGKTAWGAAIEFCRDYDPAGAGANTPPHYAALRIHKSVSDGLAPDPSDPSKNAIISF